MLWIHFCFVVLLHTIAPHGKFKIGKKSKFDVSCNLHLIPIQCNTKHEGKLLSPQGLNYSEERETILVRISETLELIRVRAFETLLYCKTSNTTSNIVQWSDYFQMSSANGHALGFHIEIALPKKKI